MVKVMYLLFKKSGLSDEEFYRYWKEKHGPLALRIVPGLKKYLQDHFVKLPNDRYEGNGFVELWFDDLEAYKRWIAWRQTEAGQELLDDEDRFMDRSKTIRYAVKEHVFR